MRLGLLRPSKAPLDPPAQFRRFQDLQEPQERRPLLQVPLVVKAFWVQPVRPEWRTQGQLVPQASKEILDSLIRARQALDPPAQQVRVPQAPPALHRRPLDPRDPRGDLGPMVSMALQGLQVVLARQECKEIKEG